VKICLPYGNETVEAHLDWGRSLGTIDIEAIPEIPDRDAAIRAALERPIGLEKNIFELVSPGETVVILVSDIFRQTRADQVLPILLDGLNEAGVADSTIHILFASGTHRAPTSDEQASILGNRVYARLAGRIHVHNPRDGANLVSIGTTSRGTPVTINRRAYKDKGLKPLVLIATGAVVLHYFGGYGGGRKSVVPGIAGLETISHNHAMNLDPKEDRLNPAVQIGVLDGNPVAEDMLEGARFAGVDYIVNTVLNGDQRIAGVFAGDLDAAHRAAAACAHRLFAVPIRAQADLVIASSGSAQNFVQSHKALYNAYRALKPGGRIVFLSQCKEGLGGDQFAKWLRLGNRAAIIAELRKHSEINGQTALSSIEKGPSAIFLTEMSEADVALLGGRKASSLEEALEWARADLAHKDGERNPAGEAGPTFYLMPSASYSVPFVNV